MKGVDARKDILVAGSHHDGAVTLRGDTHHFPPQALLLLEVVVHQVLLGGEGKLIGARE